MIIYSGNGPIAFAGLLIAFGVALLTKVITDTLPQQTVVQDIAPRLALVVGFAAAALWCWWLGRRWNKEATVHTVYGIPFQYFAFGYGGFALFGLVSIVGQWLA